MRLSGNTILITGGSSGIGLNLAKAFLEQQNKVIITGRNMEKLKEIKALNPGLFIYPCELNDLSAIRRLVTFIENEFPDLNILVNNAGVQYNYSFINEVNLIRKIDEEVSTNFIAPVKLTALLLPVLLKHTKSAIINVSSGLAISPKKSASVYCATKSAIHSYTKTLRYQLKGTGTSVFELIPPLVATPMTEGRDKSKKLSPDELTIEFLHDLKNDRLESYIGKSKILRFLHRLSPGLADHFMKDGA